LTEDSLRILHRFKDFSKLNHIEKELRFGSSMRTSPRHFGE